MTRTAMRKAATKLIEEYTGDKVFGVEVIADPVVPNTYAIRTLMAGWGYHDYLIQRVALDVATEADLEEVEFATWPPRSR